jgi:hypothetical protein
VLNTSQSPCIARDSSLKMVDEKDSRLRYSAASSSDSSFKFLIFLQWKKTLPWRTCIMTWPSKVKKQEKAKFIFSVVAPSNRRVIRSMDKSLILVSWCLLAPRCTCISERVCKNSMQ